MPWAGDHAYMPGAGQRPQRVSGQPIAHGLRPGRLTLDIPPSSHTCKARTIRLPASPRLPLPALPGGLARCPAAHPQSLVQGLFALRVDDQTVAGHGYAPDGETWRSRRQIRKNIPRDRMFQISDRPCAAGNCTNLEAALSEERTVVLLVPLHNQKWRPRPKRAIRQNLQPNFHNQGNPGAITCVAQESTPAKPEVVVLRGVTRHCEHPSALCKNA